MLPKKNSRSVGVGDETVQFDMIFPATAWLVLYVSKRSLLGADIAGDAKSKRLEA
jgi:hypothetical protein